ncbi:MAG: PIN domain-containing protein [Gaiellaceae bacterium]
MIIVDTSAVFAALDRSQRQYDRVSSFLENARERLVLSPFVLGELDYLLARRVGDHAALELLRDVEAGAYLLAEIAPEDVSASRKVIEQFDDLGIGLADASVVVLAARHRTNRVLTLDERHFRPLRTLDGKPFTLLPADA